MMVMIVVVTTHPTSMTPNSTPNATTNTSSTTVTTIHPYHTPPHPIYIYIFRFVGFDRFENVLVVLATYWSTMVVPRAGRVLGDG